jgi:hypothetical protein
MGMGSMTLTCLLMAIHAGSPDTTYLNDPRFKIPITIDPARRAEIRELVLYVSKDQGKSWEQYARAKPQQEAFTYFAPADGSYWFSVAVVYASGKEEPPNIMQAPVGRKIVVDTAKPLLTLSAERKGEQVLARWEIREDNPATETLRLEYRVADSPGSEWTPVAVMPGSQGQASFRPNGPGALSLRLQLEDLAHNQGIATAEVPAATGGTIAGSQGAPALPPPPNLTPVSAHQVTNEKTATDLPPDIMPPPGEKPRDFVPPTSPPSGPGSPVVAGTNNTTPPTAPAPTPQPRGSLPPLQIVNKRQIRLEFEVAKFGPSGLGGVDIYVTLDDGQTWEKSQADPGVTLPPAVDAKTGAPVHGFVTVNLQKEAVTYGFYLVVKSRAGLGKPPPQKGDLPQIRVEMDTTMPEGELLRPQPDPAHHDALILSWKASDRNLTATPITLEWAAKKEGPWECIGPHELPNTGTFSWQVPENAPPSVYLRLSIRDTAGNVAVAQTAEPILVDLSVPEVNVIGLDKNPMK